MIPIILPLANVGLTGIKIDKIDNCISQDRNYCFFNLHSFTPVIDILLKYFT